MTSQDAYECERELEPTTTAEEHHKIQVVGTPENILHQTMLSPPNIIATPILDQNTVDQHPCSPSSDDKDRKIESEDHDDVAITKIANRISQNEFPFVTSEEFINNQHIEDSSWLEDFMMQVEYVELQSFIDKHYEKYVQDNPMVDRKKRHASKLDL